MSVPCVIVVRRARTADEPARAELVRRGLTSHQWEAFLLFFFQELTLQCCVLGGAVLFIFCGASAGACALLLPAAAALAAAAVYVAHLALADTMLQKMRQEVVGLVAEYRGPLVNEPGRVWPRVVCAVEGGAEWGQEGGAEWGREGGAEWGREGGAEWGREGGGYSHARLVGTVSVAECWGSPGGGWMYALAVHPQWRRRGVGRALVEAAGAAWGAHAGGAGAGGLGGIECVVSELQHAARALLHRTGWEARGWYHRQVFGRALTLQLARFTAPSLSPSHPHLP